MSYPPANVNDRNAPYRYPGPRSAKISLLVGDEMIWLDVEQSEDSCEFFVNYRSRNEVKDCDVGHNVTLALRAMLGRKWHEGVAMELFGV